MSHHFQTCLNGDRPETLKNEFMAVFDLAQKLDEALRKVTVHGRNYQTLDGGDELFALDDAAKREMRVAVERVRRWAEDGAMRAMDQGAA